MSKRKKRKASSGVKKPAFNKPAFNITITETKGGDTPPAVPESTGETVAAPESTDETIAAQVEGEPVAVPESTDETVAAQAEGEPVAAPEEPVAAQVEGEPVAAPEEPVAAPEEPVAAQDVEALPGEDPFDCPDVSVVIPMYNAENYIGEVMDSLLAQTFKRFEVIVVDDCSTDASPAIVDSYIPKFGGRLTHFRLRRNSGGAGIPRNNGITLARGEYIYFMDSDDRIVPNALEDDFKLAKEYDADVLYHTLFYNLSADGTESKLARVPKYQDGDTVELDEDLLTRVRELAQNKYYHAPWRSFSRRTFLVENELYFPNIRPYEDIVWNYALLIYCKRFLRVPTATYFYRDNESSMLRTEKSAAQNAKFYLNPIILGLKSLDTFISRHEFFETKPQLYYALLENYFNGRFTSLFKDNSSELQSFALYETLKDEFGKSLGDYDVLIPALCAALAQQQRVTAAKLKQFKDYVVQSKRRIAELEAEIVKRKSKG